MDMTLLTPVDSYMARQLAADSHSAALAIEIDSPEMLAIAIDELREITARRKRVEEERLRFTRPLDSLKSQWIDRFKPYLESLEQDEQLLRKGVLDYQQAEREKADKLRREAEAKQAAERAAAEAARREAERAERDAREAAQRASNEAEREAAAQAAAAAALAREAAAEKVELAELAPMPVIAASPKADGVSTRQTWKAEVTDLRALVLAAAERAQRGDDTLLAFLTPDTKALAGAARSMRNKLNVPGVRVYAEESLSVRRA